MVPFEQPDWLTIQTQKEMILLSNICVITLDIAVSKQTVYSALHAASEPSLPITESVSAIKGKWWNWISCWVYLQGLTANSVEFMARVESVERWFWMLNQMQRVESGLNEVAQLSFFLLFSALDSCCLCIPYSIIFKVHHSGTDQAGAEQSIQNINQVCNWTSFESPHLCCIHVNWDQTHCKLGMLVQLC